MKILVKVIAGAKQNKIEQCPDGSLKVRLTAIREKNKANQQLIALLAEHYNLPKSNVEILCGHTISHKIINLGD